MRRGMEGWPAKYFEGCQANGVPSGSISHVTLPISADGPVAGRTDEEEPLLEVQDKMHRPPPGRSSWRQTTCALLALQLGWGLWLFPEAFARLGWYTGSACLVLLGLLTAYSGMLFSRLYLSTPGAVLFGDIGHAAAGSFGRNVVYVIIYSLDATRCVILHLAASESLRHTFPDDSMPPLWQCGLVVLVVAAVLVQVRSLAELTWVFTAGTLGQVVAISIVVLELLKNSDPAARHSTQAVTWDNLELAAVAVMDMVFAFGGQFAFVEIMSCMRRPQQFTKSITVCTAIMGFLYGAVGVVGYWSRGDSINGIIIFRLGQTPCMRFASACILVQATSQYLVNLNVWTHNLLVLLARGSSLSPSPPGRSDGQRSPAPHAEVQCSGDHCRWRWLLASVFVCCYSFYISTAVPFFGPLVGLVTSATYLLCAYALPAWFSLRLLGHRLGPWESALLWALIPLSFALSGLGLYGSIKSLSEDMQGGEGGGWSRQL